PIDHHQLAALVAPRALLILGNTDYEWLADESGYVSSRAAKEVWNAFGIRERMGYSIQGGHPHCQLPLSQSPEVTAFIRRFLLDDNTMDTNVAKAPMFESVDWQRWTPWQ
ncbi:MAG: glycoside hydrolase, partial [Muribaculaceae bacterium]|nr:glycoside hydrolase [Muribaculaceae bacterium]